MKINPRLDSPLRKKARRGFQGYPVGTVAFYGPDDARASKVVAAVLEQEGSDAEHMRRWFSEATDLRYDSQVERQILAYFRAHGVQSVAMAVSIIGCPHEEGIDYEGEVCPQCPFWAGRDRWAGEFQRGASKAEQLARWAATLDRG